MLFCQAPLTLPLPRQMLKEREDAFVPTHTHAGYEGSLVILCVILMGETFHQLEFAIS